MIREIDVLSRELVEDTESRVVVFQSADPEFFIAHADVDLIRNLAPVTSRPTELNIYVAALERIRTLPMASIGKIAAIARGGGSEFLLSLDMRFAATATYNTWSARSRSRDISHRERLAKTASNNGKITRSRSLARLSGLYGGRSRTIWLYQSHTTGG